MYDLRKPRQKKPDVFQTNLWYYLILDRFYKHCTSIKWWEVSSQIKTLYYTSEKKCLYHFNTCHLIFFFWSPQFSPNQHVLKMITCSLILLICHVYMHISIKRKNNISSVFYWFISNNNKNYSFNKVTTILHKWHQGRCRFIQHFFNVFMFIAL